MDSKITKSQQCSLERSHTVFIEISSDQGLALFKQKQILKGLLVKKIYKNRTMEITLFNPSMLVATCNQ